jgi:hypothetical protein
MVESVDVGTGTQDRAFPSHKLTLSAHRHSSLRTHIETGHLQDMQSWCALIVAGALFERSTQLRNAILFAVML